MNGAGYREVYRDDDLLVVDKDPHLATTAPNDGDCLTKRLASALRIGGGAPRLLHATSRLDAPVTGLVTYALRPSAEKRLREARIHGRYTRVYLALVSTPFDVSNGEWNIPIGIHLRDRRLRSPDGRKRRQDAQTRFVRRGSFTLELRPTTGRTHQLRVHASHAGFPLVGDRAYGGVPRVTLSNGRVIEAARVMLHCAVLQLPLSGGSRRTIRAPIPNDFRRCHEALGEKQDSLLVDP